MSSKRIESLKEMLEPAVNAVGMELWGIEYLSQGKHSILRVYIDSEDGVTIDNCEAASHQVSGVLDVEDPINGEYNLEVSSPGMDRPLFNFDQFAMYQGELIKVRLQMAVNGMRNFTGKLLEAKDDVLTFQVDNQQLTVSINQIDKANLVPIFD
ncbi:MULTISPECIES: ribosome maturation factor RimP [unclassified Ketobacter]|uniref:ribosome maturation factor RimP n=1 Tax=unclassified Ketobacter TaxID=2639109 RepID=UPI0025BA29AF|nr:MULTISPECIES: ribosome maturation factor RimP [unclassified Ketobacter]MEC8811923.1 ribosome maturation factor RimP [Pseudomonadota bacterium]